jgi:hypothetical protein
MATPVSIPIPADVLNRLTANLDLQPAPVSSDCKHSISSSAADNRAHRLRLQQPLLLPCEARLQTSSWSGAFDSRARRQIVHLRGPAIGVDAALGALHGKGLRVGGGCVAVDGGRGE